MLANRDDVICAGMRMVEEYLAVGCDNLAARHAPRAQGSKRFGRAACYSGCEFPREWCCVGVPVDLMLQRWLWFGAAKDPAHLSSFRFPLSHHVDPAVAQAVKAVEWAKPVLLLVG